MPQMDKFLEGIKTWLSAPNLFRKLTYFSYFHAQNIEFCHKNPDIMLTDVIHFGMSLLERNYHFFPLWDKGFWVTRRKAHD